MSLQVDQLWGRVGGASSGSSSSSSSTLAPSPHQHAAGSSNNITVNFVTSMGGGSRSDGLRAMNFSVFIAVVFCSCTLAVVLFLIGPTWLAVLRRRRQLRTAIQRATQEAASRASEDSSLHKIRRQPAAERYASIEAWLVSKPVTAHDAVCDRVRSSKTTLRTSSSSGSLSSIVLVGDTTAAAAGFSEETNSSSSKAECPICFDTIEPGDVVSWSPQPDCGHVFHHMCLKEWLVRNENCPFCRQTCLPIDGAVESNKKQIMDLLISRQHRDMPCFYCAEHGVVRPPSHLLVLSRSSHGTKEEEEKDAETSNDLAFFATLQERAHQTSSREDLQRMRGSSSGSSDHSLVDRIEDESQRDANYDESGLASPPTDSARRSGNADVVERPSSLEEDFVVMAIEAVNGEDNTNIDESSDASVETLQKEDVAVSLVEVDEELGLTDEEEQQVNNCMEHEAQLESATAGNQRGRYASDHQETFDDSPRSDSSPESNSTNTQSEEF